MKIDFLNKPIFLITKHEKEKIIFPLIEKAWNPSVKEIVSFDTDLLGTFSGEIERKGGPIECLRQKIDAAVTIHKKSGIYIASEGSFGAHPYIPFVSINEEFIGIFDTEQQFYHYTQHISTACCYLSEKINSTEDLISFISKINFPIQGVILKTNHRIHKDINDFQELLSICENEEFENVTIETDLRAHKNPHRQKVIAETSQKLINEMNSNCPKCETPGFAVRNYEKGLPCSLCGNPTESINVFIENCLSCGYELKKINPVKEESPQYCSICNP